MDGYQLQRWHTSAINLRKGRIYHNDLMIGCIKSVDKKAKIYNYKNLYELVSVAPKLLNCRVNMTYFVKNHEILMTYFENEEQIPWKHRFYCKCEDYNSYVFETNASPFGMEF